MTHCPSPVCLAIWRQVASLEGDIDASLEAYTRALEIKPDCVACWENVVAMTLLKGNYREALIAAESGLQVSPGNPK